MAIGVLRLEFANDAARRLSRNLAQDDKSKTDGLVSFRGFDGSDCNVVAYDRAGDSRLLAGEFLKFAFVSVQGIDDVTRTHRELSRFGVWIGWSGGGFGLGDYTGQYAVDAQGSGESI